MEKKEQHHNQDAVEISTSADISDRDTTIPSSSTENPPHSRAGKLWKNTCTTLKKIHPTWYVTLGFALLLASVIVHYESRDDMIWSHRYGPVMELRMSPYSERYSDRYDHFDNMFEDMDRSFRDMERRHERMMESMRRIPAEMTNGQYSGAKIVDNSTLTYNISKNIDTTSGTITSSESGALIELETALKNLGYTVMKQDTTLSFSGNTDTTDALMDILK